MKCFLGIDTSNYTTSVAVFDGETMLQSKRLLPVKEGERGIRQSDAVFHHTKNYPELISSLFQSRDMEVAAVGASVSPTTQNGSYMPCFLVGESTAKSISSVNGVPFYGFSHQQGHIAAALYSTGKTHLIGERFFAFHISGGTTELLLCEPDGNGLFNVGVVSSSSDLKAGQAVDRIGVKMQVPFPAGKGVELLANKSERTFKNKIKLYDGNCSLSGLENKCLKMLADGSTEEDTAKFLLTYIADTVCAMVSHAFERFGKLPLVFAGGVMSDKIIRDIVLSRFDAYFAEPDFSCDNAAGIAYLTYLKSNGYL